MPRCSGQHRGPHASTAARPCARHRRRSSSRTLAELLASARHPSRSRRQPGRIGAPGGMRMVGRWGDRQHPADRLDPIRPRCSSMKAIMACVGGRAPPGKIRARLRRTDWPAEAPGSPARGLEPGCHIARQTRPVPLSRSAFFTIHSASATCSLSCSLSRRSLTIATHARARDQPPAVPHAHGPQAKICSLPCLYRSTFSRVGPITRNAC